jgi:hypothetical protein
LSQGVIDFDHFLQDPVNKRLLKGIAGIGDVEGFFELF